MEASLRFAYHSPFSWIIVLAVTLFAVTFFVIKLRSISSLRQKIYLGLLRFSSIAIVFVVFLNPTITMQEVELIKPTVLVLVDASSSTRIKTDRNNTVENMIRRFFQKNGAYFEELEKTRDVRYFAFGGNIVRITRDQILSSDMPELGSTDILHATKMALVGVDSLGGAIIITDTFHENLGKSLEQIGALLSEPILVLLADATPAPPYIAITKIKGDAFLLSRNSGEIVVSIFALVTEKMDITVALGVDGKKKLSKIVQVSPDQKDYSVTFPIFFDSSGRHFVEVRTFTGTREFSKAYKIVEVARDNIRVIHIAGAPSWDVRFLREYLRSRSDVETISFYILIDTFEDLMPSEQETVLIPFPVESFWSRNLYTSDLLVLQDYKGELDPTDRMMTAHVEAFVRNGGGLLIISGDSAPCAVPLLGQFADFLPVSGAEICDRNLVDGEWALRVPENEKDNMIVSRNHLALRLEKAPTISSLLPVEKVSEGAVVLVEGVERGKSFPVLVVKEYLRGRIGMILTDTLWRLSFNQDSRDIYADLLDGILGYLTKDPRFMPIVVKTSKDRLEPYEEARFRVLHDPYVKGLEAKIYFLDKNGEFEEVSRIDVAKDEFTFVGREHGLYRIELEGVMGGKKVRGEECFVVGHSMEEMVVANEDLSRIVVSLRNKGPIVQRLEQASLEHFKPKKEVKKVGGARSKTPIGLGFVNLLGILLLLSLEWFVEWKVLRREQATKEI